MYCMYLRKSRADLEAEQHGEGETLAKHERLLADLAKKLRLPVSAIYKEIVSGETIAARPMMQRLLNEVEQGKWTGVLVVEVERLARGDTMDQGQVAKSFKMAGTKIITPVKTYDPNNEFDEEYFEFGLFMSRREYKTINRRLQGGRIASLKEGKVINSTAPFGYEKIKAPDGKGYTLRQVPDESNAVRLIFDMYKSGSGSIQICDKLNQIGVKPRISKSWSPSSVRDILKNPTYAGKVRWEWKKEIKRYEDGLIKKSRSRRKDYQIYDGLHEGIISWEDYLSVQDTLNHNNHSGTPKMKLQNPLSGIVYCKQCGAKMTRMPSNKKNPYDKLMCSNRHCSTVSTPLYLVENEIIRGLKQWLNDIVNDKLISKVDDSSLRLISENVLSTSRELEELKSQRTKIFEFLEKGIYTPEIFAERSCSLTEKIQQTETKLVSLQEEYDKEEYRLKSKVNLVPDIENLIDVYPRMNADERNTALKKIIDTVTYEKMVKNTRSQRDKISFKIWIKPKIK